MSPGVWHSMRQWIAVLLFAGAAAMWSPPPLAAQARSNDGDSEHQAYVAALFVPFCAEQYLGFFDTDMLDTRQARALFEHITQACDCVYREVLAVAGTEFILDAMGDYTATQANAEKYTPEEIERLAQAGKDPTMLPRGRYLQLIAFMGDKSVRKECELLVDFSTAGTQDSER